MLNSMNRSFTVLSLSPELTGRILSKIAILPDKPDQCWLWTGAETSYGYGHFSVNGRLWLAHRTSYFIFTGRDPKELLVCHKCDVRLCCNPNHLFLGTHDDNQKDMAQKGRSAQGDRHASKTHPEKIKRGEIAPRAKLTDKDVTDIRRIYKDGGISASQLAKRFDVTPSNIQRIVTGGTWAHLPVFGNPETFTKPSVLGDANPSAKLTEEKVKQIRQMRGQGLLYREIAAKFDVTSGTIQAIIAGTNWAHVK